MVRHKQFGGPFNAHLDTLLERPPPEGFPVVLGQPAEARFLKSA